MSFPPIKKDKRSITLAGFEAQTNIARFKDDIINSISEIQDRLTNRLNTLETIVNSKLAGIDSCLMKNDKTHTEQKDKIELLSHNQEKLKDLPSFQKKCESSLMSQEIKISNLSKEMTNAFFKYDKMILENMLIPGQVGEFCRFKNLKECISYILDHISTNNQFNDKIKLELKQFKEKFSEHCRVMTFEKDESKKFIMRYTKEKNNLCEQSLKEKIDEYQKKVEEAKIENNVYVKEFKEVEQKLKEEMTKMNVMKEEMQRSTHQSIINAKKENQITIDHMNLLTSEFNKINQLFHEIAEFIKDVRFRNNISTEQTKKDITKLRLNLIPNSFNRISYLGNSTNEASNFSKKRSTIRSNYIKRTHLRINSIKETSKSFTEDKDNLSVQSDGKRRYSMIICNNSLIAQSGAITPSSRRNQTMETTEVKESNLTLERKKSTFFKLRELTKNATTNSTIEKRGTLFKEKKNLLRNQSYTLEITPSKEENFEKEKRKEKTLKTKKNKGKRLNPLKSKVTNSLEKHLKGKNGKKEHYIYKLIKMDNGKLKQSTSSTNFDPKRVIQ